MTTNLMVVEEEVVVVKTTFQKIEIIATSIHLLHILTRQDTYELKCSGG